MSEKTPKKRGRKPGNTKSNKTKSPTPSAQEKNIRKQFTNWLLKTYDITYFPRHFYINLDKVYNGKYRDMAKPVPVEDLFDMWKRKIEWLNKINVQNAQKGKKIQGYLRVNYDLAILLSKYDSYLAWKKKNSTESEGIEKSENILTPETQKILVDKKLNIQETISDKTINIQDIIDEI